MSGKRACGALVGVRGQYAGARIILPAGEDVTLGRDPEVAHIVLDNSCRLVSRKHCVVRYQPQTDTYRVTDYSRNGTFLDNGDMLMLLRPIVLQRGAILCLGDREQAFLLG